MTVRLKVEHQCPGMEATDKSLRQEIPNVPTIPVRIDLTTGKLDCRHVYSKFQYCNRPFSGEIPEKPERSSGRVGCRYLFPEGTVWQDVNGNDVSEIEIIIKPE